MKRITTFTFAIFALAILGACAAGTEKTEAVKDESPKATEEAPVSAELMIVDITPGVGDGAQPGDTVLVNYTGWLYENGKRTKQFDSSVGRAPFEVTIGVTGVIKGWTEGLVGMRVNGKRDLIIPPELGYGSRGAGGVIPANATLDFEIECLKLAKKK